MEETYVTSTNRTIAHTFLWMFLGLIATGIIAGVTFYTGLVVNMLEWWNFNCTSCYSCCIWIILS